MPRFRQVDTATDDYNLKGIISNTGSANDSRMDNGEPDQVYSNIEKVNDDEIDSKPTPDDIGLAIKK